MGRWTILTILSVLIIPFMQPVSEAVDATLLEKTIMSATSIMSPSNDASISYDTEAKHVYISFTTPLNYRVSSADAFSRWRHNQWVVLQEFKLSKIPVARITIESNLLEGKGSRRYTHTAENSDTYGDLKSNRFWLKTAIVEEKKADADTWEKIKK